MPPPEGVALFFGFSLGTEVIVKPSLQDKRSNDQIAETE